VTEVNRNGFDRRQTAAADREIRQSHIGTNLIADPQARGAIVGPTGAKFKALGADQIETSPDRRRILGSDMFSPNEKEIIRGAMHQLSISLTVIGELSRFVQFDRGAHFL
jgi:hypothetical protein